MTGLVRYINVRFFLNLIICLIAVLIVSFLIDTVESSKTVTQTDVRLSVVFSLLFNKFLVMLVQTFPLAVYISIIILLFRLHIKNEYMAFLTSAIEPSRLIIIILPALIFLGVVDFVLLDRVMPPASRRVDRLLVSEFKRFTASWTYFYRDRNWFLSTDRTRLYYYSDIDEGGMNMKNFEIYGFSEAGVGEMLLSDIAVYAGNNEYILKNVRSYIFGERDLPLYEAVDEKRIYLPDEFDNFKQRRGRPYQMDLLSLLATINYRERVGLDTSRFRYELYMKIVNPLSLVLLCLIFIFIFIRYLYLLYPGYLVFAGLLILLFYIIAVIFSGKLAEASIGEPFFAAVLPICSLLIIVSLSQFFAGIKDNIYRH